ncbi:Hint domain-containing protein [Archangium violaceum]|uniref:Hint domain-containing protein n=1 Tax=Archangium violaceum TaxID=83451 RepID=UPI001EF5404D|nr:Hint domain-containing protein [Archangium violaceum]
MQTRTQSKWKQAARLVPLSGLMLMTAGWTNPLYAPVGDAEQSERLVRKFDEATRQPDVYQIDLDLSDDQDWAFLRSRLKSAGKSAENSPELFRRLDYMRERALTRKDTAGLAATETWCNHFLKYSQPPVTANGFTTFFPVVEVACKDGAEYVYADLVNYDVNDAETDTRQLSSASGEDYSGGLNFNSVSAPATVATGKGRGLRMESMVMALGATLDQTSYIVERAAAIDSQPSLTLTHPRKVLVGAARAEIIACQLRGGADCDYAVAGYSSGRLVPYPSAPTGVAASLPTSPGVLNTADYWTFSSPYNYQNLYVPIRGTLSGGASGGFKCVITSVDRARIQLIAAVTGRTCLNETQFLGSITTGGLTSNINVLTNMNRLFNQAGAGTSPASCAAETIVNELTRYSILISGTVSCNSVTKRFFIPYPTPATGGATNIYFWNSCMAEGTSVKLADGRVVPVEEVKQGDKVVADAKGSVLTVTDVARGNEIKPLFRLRDDAGHDVTLTEMHPVIKSNGEVVATKNLKVKDQVKTDKGVATLTSITQVAADQQRVYNLRLGTDQELLAVGKNGRTLFAGGFLVGDLSMQDELQMPKQEQPVAVLERLPKAWHKDYQNRVNASKKAR